MGHTMSAPLPACSRHSPAPHAPGMRPPHCRYTSRPLENNFKVESRVSGTCFGGRVRLATGLRDQRKYAVKSFKKEGMTAHDCAHVRTEAEICLSVEHPHVARLEMVHETKDELHLVTEYLEGDTLYDRLLDQGQYSEESAGAAACQMLLVVAYLHANGIAHRDLKLENFAYEREDSNRLKLLDFAFATFTDQNDTMSQACGSLHYMAPEVLDQCYTSKADMWSVGVIVYMLLVGSPPCFGQDDEEVLCKVKLGQVHWGSRFQRLSPLAISFLKQLLVKDPDLRMNAQQALEHPWIVGKRQVPGPMPMNARSFARSASERDDRIDRTELLLAVGDALTGPEIGAILKEDDMSQIGRLDSEEFVANFYNEIAARQTRRRLREKMSLVTDASTEQVEEEVQQVSGDSPDPQMAAEAKQEQETKELMENQRDSQTVLKCDESIALTGGLDMEWRIRIAGA